MSKAMSSFIWMILLLIITPVCFSQSDGEGNGTDYPEDWDTAAIMGNIGGANTYLQQKGFDVSISGCTDCEITGGNTLIISSGKASINGNPVSAPGPISCSPDSCTFDGSSIGNMKGARGTQQDGTLSLDYARMGNTEIYNLDDVTQNPDGTIHGSSLGGSMILGETTLQIPSDAEVIVTEDRMGADIPEGKSLQSCVSMTDCTDFLSEGQLLFTISSEGDYVAFGGGSIANDLFRFELFEEDRSYLIDTSGRTSGAGVTGDITISHEVMLGDGFIFSQGEGKVIFKETPSEGTSSLSQLVEDTGLQAGNKIVAGLPPEFRIAAQQYSTGVLHDSPSSEDTESDLESPISPNLDEDKVRDAFYKALQKELLDMPEIKGLKESFLDKIEPIKISVEEMWAGDIGQKALAGFIATPYLLGSLYLGEELNTGEAEFLGTAHSANVKRVQDGIAFTIKGRELPGKTMDFDTILSWNVAYMTSGHFSGQLVINTDIGPVTVGYNSNNNQIISSLKTQIMGADSLLSVSYSEVSNKMTQQMDNMWIGQYQMNHDRFGAYIRAAIREGDPGLVFGIVIPLGGRPSGMPMEPMGMNPMQQTLGGGSGLQPQSGGSLLK
ncbi:hypothetical protein JW968_03500 [Candidatus Woesearchaeota archaeon]|nr:hypothetical protein [Candidatus Woesearchaeota archaeon]